jgi:hypothetical protein
MEDTNVNPKCSRCYNYWKPDETDIKTSGLVYKICKKCRSGKKKYKEENADTIKEQSKKYYQENADKCKEANKKYYEVNADKIKKQKKNYYEENADKVKERMKKHREENKCEHNKGLGECSICNPSLYLLNLQRKSLRRCFKIANLDKTKPTIAFLGCDVVYFKDYIQKKMDIYNQTAEVKMDLNNIHIDHIKPVSSFNLEDEEDFLDCSHYTNFQPLLAKDNLSKYNKWNEENEAYWNDNIKGKEYYDIYL